CRRTREFRLARTCWRKRHERCTVEMMPLFRMQLLGTPLITRESGEAVQIPHRHRVALLALLASAHGRTLSRDKTIGTLWPEQQTTSARNLLNVAVHGLRKALQDDVIQSV